MIDIPAAQIIDKIQEQKGLSESDVRAKIENKLKQLAGLISEDGAAHIIANELGVTLAIEPGEAKIKDLSPGMRSVTVPGVVTRKYEVREFDKNGRQGKVASFMLGDETGQVRVTLWNEQTDVFDQFSEGDTIKVVNAYAKENRGYTEIQLNTDSQLDVKPAGVTIAVNTSGPERKLVKELTGNEENVEVLGTIVQVYDPRFFDVCPQCNRRVTEQGSGVVCGQHGAVTPVTNYVVSAFLDDGTGNIRTTFWKQQTQRLLDKEDAAMLAYKENPIAFEEQKNELLGEIVKVVGKCKKNETFDRIELTANLIYRDINPEEELARLGRESSTTKPENKSATSETMQRNSSVDAQRSDAIQSAPAEQSTPVPVAEEPVTKESVSAEPIAPTRVEAPEKPVVLLDDELSGTVEEEVISLDDLEDLDEKL